MRYLLFLMVITLMACSGVKEQAMVVEVKKFGEMEDGRPVKIFTLTNRQGMEVKITEYGCIIVSLNVPDRDGKLGDVVLGYDDVQDYFDMNPFFGSIVGRYANRIADGKFSLDSQTYQLATNNGKNHLHGGLKGFDKVLWQGKILSDQNNPAIELRYLSKDGEENYPGNLQVVVTYTLTEENALKIEYRATTDKKTIINLSNHSYFNLRGSGDILGHQLMINADYFTPVDTTLIPTGEIRPVEGTPFDFRQLTAIGERINATNEQLKNGKGYDHNFILNKSGDSLTLAAKVYEPETGRLLEIHTTEPGVQFYSGNFLDGSITGKKGMVYAHRSGFCLETQHFPDSPNKPQFPSTVLAPDEKYNQVTIFKFGTK
jgi:aldose 1-epimerase